MLMYKKKTAVTTIYEVAKWFLNKEKDMPLSKLQAMCYYAYCWYLAEFNNGMQDELLLLFQEKFQAWIHGARCPELKTFYDSFEKRTAPSLPDKTTEKFLEEVWDAYGHLNEYELEHLTLSEPPFKKARQGLEPYEPCVEEINDEDIFEYFRAKAQEGVGEAQN